VLVVRHEWFLARWYLHRLESGTLEQRIAATRWLGARDRAEAIPGLAALVSAEQDEQLVVAAASALFALGDDGLTALSAAFADIDEERRVGILESVELGDLGGGDLARAIEWFALLSVDGNSFELGEFAREKLADDGFAVPAFVTLIDAGDRNLRVPALWNLRCLGPAAVDAIDAIEPLLESEDGRTAAAARAALGAIGAPAVPALLRALRRPTITTEQRGELLITLRRMGPSAASAALPSLWSALRREARAPGAESNRAFVDCARAIARIDTDTEEILSFLEARLDEGDLIAQQRASGAIAAIGPAAAPLTPALLDAMESRPPSKSNRCRFGEDALRRMGSATHPALLRALGDPRPQRRLVAAEALTVRAHSLPIETPRALLSALDDADVFTRRAVVAVFAKGVKTRKLRDAVAPLIEALDDPDAEVRIGIVEGQGWILGDLDWPPADTAAAIAAVTARLDDPAPRVRCAAIEALGRLRRGDSAAAGDLVGKLDDPVLDVRDAAADALVMLHVDLPETAIAALVRCLGDETVLPERLGMGLRVRIRDGADAAFADLVATYLLWPKVGRRALPALEAYAKEARGNALWRARNLIEEVRAQ